MDDAALIEMLKAENQRLRDRVMELEDQHGLTLEAPPEWGLTGSERRIFGALMARDLASKEHLLAACCANHGMAEQPELKIVDVFICKLRRKLPDGVTIETVWGQGYRLSAASKATARALLAEALGEVAA